MPASGPRCRAIFRGQRGLHVLAKPSCVAGQAFSSLGQARGVSCKHSMGSRAVWGERAAARDGPSVMRARRWALRLGGGGSVWAWSRGHQKRPWRACWPWGFSPHDEGALGRWRGRGMAWRSIAKAVVSAQEIEGGMFIVNQGGILRGGWAKRMSPNLRANQGELRATNRGQDTRPEHAGHGHEPGHEPARKPPSGRPPGGTETSQKHPLPGASGTMRLPKNQAKPGPPVAQLALHAAPICPINRQISPEKARKTI